MEGKYWDTYLEEVRGRNSLGLGPGDLCQGLKSLSWDYFGCGSEKQSHVMDSGGSSLCFGE